MSPYELAKWALFVAFGPLPPVAIISATTLFLVVRDVIDGRYVKGSTSSSTEQDGASPTNQSMTTWESVMLAVKMQHDMICLSEITIVLYGMVPEILAAWSLVWRGQQFEYVVAARNVSGGTQQAT